MKNKIDFWIKTLSVILISMVSLLIVLSKPIIVLNGGHEIDINYNENYKEKGYTAMFILKNVTDKVKVENNINISKLGKYTVKYSLKLGNFKITETRKVNVVDKENPTIELLGSNYACPGKEYVEEGYKAIDNYDGDITKKVKIRVNKDKVTYVVRDSSANKTSITRIITNKDIQAPSIDFIGGDTIDIELNSEFIDPGVSVRDNCDSDISYTTNGNIDTSRVGTYKITYISKDKAGNENKIDRTINVVDNGHKGIGKNIYLTFDDGPSSTITPSLLQILKEEGVKATFFVINHDDSLNYLIKQEYDEGHTVALHSYTHTYSYIYSSVDNYFNDLNSIREKVHGITGVYSNIVRFPGGSSNTVSKKYQEGIMTYLTKELTNRGYVYFDWNVTSGDAGEARYKEQVYNNVVNNLNYTNNIVLMHDFEGNYKTLNAIRDIIKYGKAQGYTFKVITRSTNPVHHPVNN